MTKENTMSFRRIYHVLLSIVIVISGIGLMLSCFGIYQSGSQPFSRESVAAAFSKIAVLLYLCLAMIIINCIWELLSPSAKEKTPMFKPYRTMLKRLQEKKDFQQGSPNLLAEITDLQKKRSCLLQIRNLIFSICSIIFLVYACNSSHFHQSQINSSMIQAMKVLLPCMLVSFCFALFVSIYEEKSLCQEIELTKQLPALARTEANEDSRDDSEKKLRPYRNVLLAASLLFIVYGFINGGTIDVLAKAINICTECIGLG